ncbi:hypothetical protein QCA50_009553 [Cerrena zonata]|uniref:Uncharacterized protein n=1 Tax=Cerrena zonata TaxID=2478898 RepID=A0AAW0G006_9APHY
MSNGLFSAATTSIPVSMPMVIDPPSGFDCQHQFPGYEGFSALVSGSAMITSNYWTETS